MKITYFSRQNQNVIGPKYLDFSRAFFVVLWGRSEQVSLKAASCQVGYVQAARGMVPSLPICRVALSGCTWLVQLPQHDLEHDSKPHGYRPALLRLVWIWRISFVRTWGEGCWAAGRSSGLKDPTWRWVHSWKEFQAGCSIRAPQEILSKAEHLCSLDKHILTVLNGIYIAHSPYQITILNKRLLHSLWG